MPTSCQATREPDTWYIGDKDLEFFKYHGEGSGATPGASAWELLMEKEIPNCIKYTSWRRVLPVGTSTGVPASCHQPMAPSAHRLKPMMVWVGNAMFLTSTSVFPCT